jgi:hypothetical protein
MALKTLIAFLGGVGGGLMFLSIGVVLFDQFFAKVLKKVYPNPEYWNEELNLPTLTPADQKTFPWRKRLYHDAVSHRFRKWGVNLFVIGALLLAVAIVYGHTASR